MSRITWFTAGAVTGVYAMFKTRSTVRNFTPDGIAARAVALAAGFRVFASEVSLGMAERESELRDQLTMPRVGLPAAVRAMIERAPAEPDAPAREGNEDRSDGHR